MTRIKYAGADPAEKAKQIAMGVRIRQRREYLKRRGYGTYTQQYVADRLEMSRMGYAHYESGENNISHQDMEKLAGILDVPVTYLFGMVDEDQLSRSESIQKYELLPPRLRQHIDNQIESVYSMLLDDKQQTEITATLIK